MNTATIGSQFSSPPARGVELVLEPVLLVAHALTAGPRGRAHVGAALQVRHQLAAPRLHAALHAGHHPCSSVSMTV